MYRFPIHNYHRFSELPFDHFNEQKFLVYILDFEWNYMFANGLVASHLSLSVSELLGKNMWQVFPELKADPDFQLLKRTMESASICNLTTQSPITNKKLSITGYRLDDCYYFSCTILPNKQSLLDELRTVLKKR
jgi:hypothetical protein